MLFFMKFIFLVISMNLSSTNGNGPPITLVSGEILLIKSLIYMLFSLNGEFIVLLFIVKGMGVIILLYTEGSRILLHLTFRRSKPYISTV